jgi:hypothetical protein
MWQDKMRYDKVPLEEENATLEEQKILWKSSNSPYRSTFFLLNLGLFMTSLLIVWTTTLQNSCSRQSPNDLLKQTSTKCVSS